MKNALQNLTAIMASLLIAGSVSAHDGHDHALAGHMSYKKNTLHVHASFPVAPVEGEETLLLLEAKDAKTHQTIELNDTVEVVLWMPSMGHGSAPTQVERALDEQGLVIPGVFHVKNVYFVMAGEWEVRVTLTEANGVKETKKFKLTIAGEDGGHDHGSHH